MKCFLLTITLLLLGVTTHASTLASAIDDQNNEFNIVAKRLASKNLTEVVVIAIKLQLECQKFNSQDVCEGVRNILDVLDNRLVSESSELTDISIAFLNGLMEGVSDANHDVIARLAEAQ